MIPVTVLTGFLGSGKTTLLARLLRTPAFARTAVIINEFGEVGIDHDLVAASEESFVELETGCLCCQVRGDLEATLADLLGRRRMGAVAPFERIVIETSGLADPAPVLNAVMAETGRGTPILLEAVVTTIDAVNGLATLAREPQSVRQVAVADRLILTKTDLIDAGTDEALLSRARQLNPRAPLHIAIDGIIDPALLCGETDSFPASPGEAPDLQVRSADPGSSPLADRTLIGENPGSAQRHPPSLLPGTQADGSFPASPGEAPDREVRSADPGSSPLADRALIGEDPGSAQRHPPSLRPGTQADDGIGGSRSRISSIPHDPDIACITIRRDAPVPAVALTLFLEALADHVGADLLRLKGLVHVAEHPDQPAVIHGVQHVFHEPRWLDRWPSDDRATRLVLIGRGLSQLWVASLLDTLAAEVAEIATAGR